MTAAAVQMLMAVIMTMIIRQERQKNQDCPQANVARDIYLHMAAAPPSSYFCHRRSQ
jgi:hypothetical protein